jgi:DNA-binding transcriptional ArsR family regulator
MQTFEALSDPVRRRILELLNDGEQTSGAVTESIRAEFGISQPAVSQHLRVLRDTGLTVVRVDGARRIYTVNRDGLAEVDAWLDRFRASWQQPLDALATELARGQRRQGRADTPDSSHTARSA